MPIGTILLLEDDEGLALLAKSRLARINYHVEWIQSPSAYNPAVPFDLIVMDLLLHDGSTGLEFYKKLTDQNISVPAILITGFGDEKVLLEALRVGVRDFVPKNDKFLEVLPLVVDRVMTEVTNERLLVRADQERILQREIESALSMANIGYWCLPFSKEPIIWPNVILPLTLSVTKRKFLRSLFATIEKEDRALVRTRMAKARKQRAVFEVPFKLKSEARYLRMKGQFEFDASSGRVIRLIGMVWDETDKRANELELAKSLSSLEQVTERLKLSMMETHHRVKNSFQIVRSLLNMELRKEGFLNEDAVKKVISYVQGLALIHDILTDNVKLHESSTEISANELIERLVSTLQGSTPDRSIQLHLDEPLFISARMASTLAVIVTELLMNAFKHGVGAIDLAVSRVGQGRGELSLTNEVQEKTTEKKQDSSNTGLGLIQFLAKTDFKSELITHKKSASEYEARIQFPCN